MSLFGKILTVFNVLAALAFLAVGLTLWSTRQRWMDSATLHELVLDGLPFDDREVDANGQNRAEELREKSLQTYFRGTDGGVVKTQRQEVERVRAQLLALADDTNRQGTRSQKLARTLLPLAETYDQRLNYQRLALDAQADKAEELQQEFEKQYNAVLSEAFVKQNWDEQNKQLSQQNVTPRDQQERREAVARLLFAAVGPLSEGEEPRQPYLTDSKAFDRFRLVVGLTQAARAVDDSALQQTAFAKAALQLLDQDRSSFVEEDQRLLGRIQALAAATDRLDFLLKAELAKVSRHQELVNARRAEVAKVEKEYQDAQELTKQKVAKQAELERALFESRQRQRDAYDVNVQLEEKIRRLEQGR
jgi:hypothetical protein